MYHFADRITHTKAFGELVGTRAIFGVDILDDIYFLTQFTLNVYLTTTGTCQLITVICQTMTKLLALVTSQRG